MSSQKVSRQFAFKFIYHIHLENLKDELEKFEALEGDQLNDHLTGKISEFKVSFLEPDAEHPNNTIDDEQFFYANKIISNCILNLEAYKENINKALKNNNINNLDKIDLSLLLAASSELKISQNATQKTIINDYINLAKKFSNADSYGLINAILDKIK